MSKGKSLLLILFLFTFFLSCKKENRCDCFKGTGSIVKESREAGDFYSVKVYDNINLILTQDTVNKIIVEAGENLLSNIKTETSNNNLTITNDNKCNWVRSFKKPVNVYLNIKCVSYIECRNSGYITTTNTIATPDSFRIDGWNSSGSIKLTINTKKSFIRMHTGAQDVIIDGSVDENYMYAAGNAFIDCRNLIANNTVINHRCSGDFFVYGKNSIGGDFTGNGNLYYFGNPTLINIKHPSGKGKVIKGD
ncbi:MAG: DUF2807 domain-containing protein [Bacteroidales bacterium]|nr:DUF2807 domain-containing protein [Bacteroidales bacterium]